MKTLANKSKLLARPKWRKCPSVTTGGKPYFWIAKLNGDKERIWVSWNRIQRSWTVSDDNNHEIPVKSEKAGKQLVEMANNLGDLCQPLTS